MRLIADAPTRRRVAWHHFVAYLADLPSLLCGLLLLLSVYRLARSVRRYKQERDMAAQQAAADEARLKAHNEERRSSNAGDSKQEGKPQAQPVDDGVASAQAAQPGFNGVKSRLTAHRVTAGESFGVLIDVSSRSPHLICSRNAPLVPRFRSWCLVSSSC